MARRGCASPHPRDAAHSHEHGYSLPELLMVLAVTTVCGALAIAPLLGGLDRARAQAATRYLAAQLSAARTQAVLRGTTVALRMENGAHGISVSLVADGNGNGVRRADLELGIDLEIRPPVRLRDHFAGVDFGAPGGSASDGVRLGGTEFLSFTPAGTSTSGSLYVLGRDGSRYALRIIGTTGRVRSERFEPHLGYWVPLV